MDTLCKDENCGSFLILTFLAEGQSVHHCGAGHHPKICAVCSFQADWGWHVNLCEWDASFGLSIMWQIVQSWKSSKHDSKIHTYIGVNPHLSHIYIYNKILLRYCIVTYCLVYSCRQSMVKVCVPCVMWRTLLFDDILIINLPWVRTLGIGRSAHFILQSSRQYLDTVYILLWCWREQWRGGQHSPRTYGICAAHLLCEWCSALDSYILSLECWDEFCAPMQWRLGGRKNLCRSWLGH